MLKNAGAPRDGGKDGQGEEGVPKNELAGERAAARAAAALGAARAGCQRRDTLLLLLSLANLLTVPCWAEGWTGASTARTNGNSSWKVWLKLGPLLPGRLALGKMGKQAGQVGGVAGFVRAGAGEGVGGLNSKKKVSVAMAASLLQRAVRKLRMLRDRRWCNPPA